MLESVARLSRQDFFRRLVPRSVVRPFFMRRERRLYQGDFTPKSTTRSILFFTVHKCASTFAPKALCYFNSEKNLGLSVFDLPAYIRMNVDDQPYELMSQRADKLFLPQGALYVPLRRFVDVPDMQDYSTILMLRDPRDILVSSYFSRRYSHTLPFRSPHQESFLEKRRLSANQTLREFIQDNVEPVRDKYLEYIEQLLARPHVQLLRYEDMILDTGGWAHDLAEAIGVSCTENDVSRLVELGGFGVKRREDVKKHVRSGKTGDFRDKLDRASIDMLNARFRPVLEALDYPV